MTHKLPQVREFAGPDRLCRVGGKVVVTIYYRPAVPDWLPAAWCASALGWGYNGCLIGTSDDRAALVAYCRERFPGCEIQATA